MKLVSAQPTGQERFFEENEIIVSKTDTKGRLTYANQLFLNIAGYSEEEILGQPHNVIRHPDMPRSVFKLLWETIKDGREIFAFVVNLCKDGAHYWVLAHVPPTYDRTGQISGYHSNRRVPDRQALAEIQSLYRRLAAVEHRHSQPKAAAEAGLEELNAILAEKKVSYDEFIFGMINGKVAVS